MAYKDWKETHFYAAASGLTSHPESGLKNVGAVTRSRAEAVAFEGLDDSDYITREHAVDPMVDRAASELVELDDKGQRVAIEIKGRPYDVLQDLLAEFAYLGASSFVTRQVLQALQKFTLHEGTNFSKTAKARPLYARIEVTDAKPDDLPDCEKFQYIFLDGVRRRGRDASTMGNIRPTIHGTQSSQSSVPGMDEMFESVKKKGLLIFFASMEDDELNSFDNTDNDLISGLQAFMDGGIGEGAGAAVIDKIEELMLSGDISPEAMELIEALADYQTALMDAQTPDAVENVADLIEALETKIETALSEDVGLSDEITAVIEQRFEELFSDTNEQMIDFDNSGDVDLSSSENDFDEGASLEIAELIEQLEIAAESGDIDAIQKALVDIEAILETSEVLPADMKQRLEAVINSVNPDTLSANNIVDAKILELVERIEVVTLAEQLEITVASGDIASIQEAISGIETILETTEALPADVKQRLEAAIGKMDPDMALANNVVDSSIAQLAERLEAVAEAVRDLPAAESNVIDAREIFQQVARADIAQQIQAQTLDSQQDNVKSVASEILASENVAQEALMQETSQEAPRDAVLETAQEIVSEIKTEIMQEQRVEISSDITEATVGTDIVGSETMGMNSFESTANQTRPVKVESALAKLQALKSQSASALNEAAPSSSKTSKIIVSPALGVQPVRPSSASSAKPQNIVPAKPNYQAPSVRVQSNQAQMPTHAPVVQVAPAKNALPHNNLAQNNTLQNTKQNIISATNPSGQSQAQPISQPKNLKQTEQNMSQKTKNETPDYKAMKAEAEFENKEEKANVTGCDGCTHKDCANCSKFANLSKFDNDMQDVKREMAQMGLSVYETQETQPVKLYETQIIHKHIEDSLKPEEKANVSGCDGCTHKDCANCSKFANLSKFDNDMQDVKREMAQMGISLAA